MPDYSNVFHVCLYTIFQAIQAVFGWFSDFMSMFGAWNYFIYVVILYGFFRFIVFPHLNSGSDDVSDSKRGK